MYDNFRVGFFSDLKMIGMEIKELKAKNWKPKANIDFLIGCSIRVNKVGKKSQAKTYLLRFKF